MRLIARMTATFATSNITRAGVGLLTAIVIGRGLGAEAFGRWTIDVAWAATLMALLDFGFASLLTRDAAHDAAQIGPVIGAAVVIRLLSCGTIAIGVLAVGPRVTSIRDGAQAVQAVLGITAAGLVYRAFAAPLKARADWLAVTVVVETASALMQLGATWWLVTNRASVVALLVAAAVLQTGQAVAASAVWRLLAPSGARAVPPGAARTIAEIRRALPFALAGFVGSAQGRVAPLLLGYLGTPIEVAGFAAATKVGNVARTISSAAFAAALPAFAAEARRGRAEGIRARFDAILAVFAVAAAAAMALGGGTFLRIAYGQAFAARPATMVWAAIALVPLLLNTSRKVFLQAIGRERASLRWSIVALGVQIAVSAVLIPAFGSTGAAAAFVAAECAIAWPLRLENHAPLSVTAAVSASLS